jgi:hypothetical protein
MLPGLLDLVLAVWHWLFRLDLPSENLVTCEVGQDKALGART